MQVKTIADCSKGRGEHSAILSTFIKVPFVIKIFVLSIFDGCLRQVLLYFLHVLLFDIVHNLQSSMEPFVFSPC